MAQNFRAPGGPQEMVAKQTDFARKSFETAVRNASDVADVIKKSGS
jgi:phasin family protein